MNLENKTDEELILLAQQNGCKDEVFTKLYKKYQKIILNYSTSLCKDRELAGEITQKTFIKIYTNFEKYTKIPDATFKTWIHTITKNTLIDYYRKNKLNNGEEILKYKGIPYISNPETEMIGKEQIKRIEREINSLQDNHKDTLRLRILGYKYREIKNILNISRNSVAQNILRARKSLKEKLDKNFFYQ